MELKKYIQLCLICLAVFLGSCCFLSPRVEAADKVVWTTTNLYYELNSDGKPKDVLLKK
ncbi:hypothetical protein SAMN04488500_1046 [Sporomusa malonica]|uniref:Uncharacterized protein n=1 Tax=Sporomusa malonica TaxID=112901 RepID=A0A1W1ZK70_9FIRM|nr:hypothetical protein SAMN04488500_1046 [Sporomusa malonica]